MKPSQEILNINSAGKNVKKNLSGQYPILQILVADFDRSKNVYTICYPAIILDRKNS